LFIVHPRNIEENWICFSESLKFNIAAIIRYLQPVNERTNGINKRLDARRVRVEIQQHRVILPFPP
jgi:hypothetical protein